MSEPGQPGKPRSAGFGPAAAQEGHRVKRIYLAGGTAIAALALAALALAAPAGAFMSPLSASQAAVRHVSARPATARPEPQPMIPAKLPAGAAGASAIGEAKTVGSANWAGYAVSRGSARFNRISARFFVPYLNCAVSSAGSARTYSSHWVGIDGFTSKTVEQDGIEADCVNSGAQYFAWREVYPRYEVRSSMKIYPGNAITASVSYSRSTHKFRMAVRDHSDGHHFTVFDKCSAGSCKRSSAEVISEAPTVGGNQSSLADYGALSFAHISITSAAGHHGGITSGHWTRTRIVQVGYDTNAVIARPTDLSGTSFDIYWLGEN
jgi:hypothetical protein